LGGRIAISTRSIGTVFGQILQDVIVNGREKKCVITMSWSQEASMNGIIPEHWKTATDDMKRLMNERDCVIVKSAGNERESDGTNENISAYPGIFASDNLPLINVGSVDIHGAPAATSQRGPLLSTWAVGAPVQCASDEGNVPRELRGTSFGKLL
jgi:subtilisin family serine protease